MAEITVPYNEIADHSAVSEGNDEQGGWAKKDYGVLWENRILFARQVMGGSTMSGGIGGSWNRQFPLQYPDDPTLYAKSVDIKPFGPWIATTPLTFKQAIVTVNFRAPNWNYEPAIADPLFLNSFSQDATENEALANCTQSLSFAAEYNQVPGESAVYESDSAKVKTPMYRRVMVARMVLTYNKLPYMPLARIFTYSDVLNNDTFLGRPRGTVMLEGAGTDRTREADGTVTQKVTISLKTRKVDWNEMLRPDGTWDMVYLGLSGGLPDTTKTAMEYVDMKPLLFIGA